MRRSRVLLSTKTSSFTFPFRIELYKTARE
jgi:hypothetical protein